MRLATILGLPLHPSTAEARERAAERKSRSKGEQEYSARCQRRFAANRRRRLASRLHREFKRYANHLAAVARARNHLSESLPA